MSTTPPKLSFFDSMKALCWMRLAMSSRTRAINSGLAARRPRKLSPSSLMTSDLTAARTVAERASPLITAISPT
jgi:hypothetical protein